MRRVGLALRGHDDHSPYNVLKEELDVGVDLVGETVLRGELTVMIEHKKSIRVTGHSCRVTTV